MKIHSSVLRNLHWKLFLRTFWSVYTFQFSILWCVLGFVNAMVVETDLWMVLKNNLNKQTCPVLLKLLDESGNQSIVTVYIYSFVMIFWKRKKWIWLLHLRAKKWIEDITQINKFVWLTLLDEVVQQLVLVYCKFVVCILVFVNDLYCWKCVIFFGDSD